MSTTTTPRTLPTFAETADAIGRAARILGGADLADAILTAWRGVSEKRDGFTMRALAKAAGVSSADAQRIVNAGEALAALTEAGDGTVPVEATPFAIVDVCNPRTLSTKALRSILNDHDDDAEAMWKALVRGAKAGKAAAAEKAAEAKRAARPNDGAEATEATEAETAPVSRPTAIQRDAAEILARVGRLGTVTESDDIAALQAAVTALRSAADGIERVLASADAAARSNVGARA